MLDMFQYVYAGKEDWDYIACDQWKECVSTPWIRNLLREILGFITLYCYPYPVCYQVTDINLWRQKINGAFWSLNSELNFNDKSITIWYFATLK
jgi:hypothetical protein